MLKSKTKGLHKTSGRNNQGKITVRHCGGKKKKAYRKLTFFAPLKETSFFVERLEYDPNRHAKILRVFSSVTKSHSYFLSSSNLEVGCFLQKKKIENPYTGFSSNLFSIPLGTLISSIGTNFRLFRGIFQRAAGTFGQLLQKGELFSILKLNSGKKSSLQSKVYAVVGAVAHFLSQVKNAGSNRRKGVRPTVRGTAMNPIDHPHGGGEGKSSSGRPSVTPWGKPAHGKKKISY